jgi:hypothetical protein
MTFRDRIWVMGAFVTVALAVFGTAKFYAPALMIYVTEQTLIQKSPAGTNLEDLHRRFHAYISSLPDTKTKLADVMAISQYLEKIQHLTPQELDHLLEAH